ncbi:MAG: RbsD/FucU family protein [Fimbriimonas sp.]
MLKSQLLHPEILSALGSAGHGSKVVIGDSNFPFRTHTNPDADLVFLNLAPGKLNAVEVAEVIASAIPIEAAAVMTPADGVDAPIFAEFRSLLGGMELQGFERFAFYDEARSSDVCLVIATGEQRIYANLILTIGVIPPA